MRILFIQVLFGVFAVFASAASRPSAMIGFTRAVDQLCAETGLVRIGEIKLLERGEYASTRYHVEVPLRIEDKKYPYYIVLDDTFKITEFRPLGWPLVRGHLVEYPPGYDTYRDSRGRRIVLAAVERFNERHDYKPPGKPAIQSVGPYLLITYQWTSNARGQAGVPYRYGVLSFIVSPHGTVCGQLWGTWPTSGKWPLLPLPGSHR